MVYRITRIHNPVAAYNRRRQQEVHDKTKYNRKKDKADANKNPDEKSYQKGEQEST